MRARLPDESGYVVNSGVRIHYEAHGTGQPTILLLPTWAIVDSRHWKMQVPFLARNYRVITFDPRGNGRSDRPADPAAYADAAFASDIGAVLDATGTERAVLGAFCSGFPWALLFAAAHPQRVSGLIAIGPTLPVPPASPWAPDEDSFDDVMDTTEGWAKENRHHWQRDWRGYVGERQVVLILAPLHELSHGTLVIVTRHPPTPPAYGNNHALSPVTPLGLQVA